MQNLLLCDKRKAILLEKGHILVLGGPGSGKTTIALLKAIEYLKAGLSSEQQILFLSFSKAAVSRIMYAAGQYISSNLKSKLLVQTYHSFCLNVLKTYAPLLGVKYPLKPLAPYDEAHMRIGIEPSTWELELEKMFYEQGKIAFSLFTPKTLLILQNSTFLKTLFSEVFPVVILDEFQDTDEQQWQLIQLFSEKSQIIALADIEQQIFDYRPEVSSKRIEQYKEYLNPIVFDLEYENNRSVGNEIQEFGFHLIRSQSLKPAYNGVEIIRYQQRRENADAKLKLKASVIKAFQKIPTDSPKKSVAVLARSDKVVAEISKILMEPIQQIQLPLKHDTLIDENFALLSARFVAFLMEPITDPLLTAAEGLDILANCFKSKDRQTSIALAQRLSGWSQALSEGRTLRNPAIPMSLISICRSLKESGLSGNPLNDWILVQNKLEQSSQKDLQDIADASRLIKLLTNGSNLVENLSNIWRMNGCYVYARQILEQTLISEQMMTSYKSPSGLIVMNIHKSKGKEFDAVVLFEGQYNGRFTAGDIAPFLSSRKLLRVGITRARHHVFILTPYIDPSPLFNNGTS